MGGVRVGVGGGLVVLAVVMVVALVLVVVLVLWMAGGTTVAVVVAAALAGAAAELRWYRKGRNDHEEAPNKFTDHEDPSRPTKSCPNAFPVVLFGLPYRTQS